MLLESGRVRLASEASTETVDGLVLERTPDRAVLAAATGRDFVLFTTGTDFLRINHDLTVTEVARDLRLVNPYFVVSRGEPCFETVKTKPTGGSFSEIRCGTTLLATAQNERETFGAFRLSSNHLFKTAPVEARRLSSMERVVVEPVDDVPVGRRAISADECGLALATSIDGAVRVQYWDSQQERMVVDVAVDGGTVRGVSSSDAEISVTVGDVSYSIDAWQRP